MATKKQKREAALAKRAQFLAEVKARGLEAQVRDQEAQKEWRKDMAEVATQFNIRHKKILAAHGIPA
jgi:hypothetical protein